ncbi:acyltransferase family protein [Butyrivibrio sp.]|uniref:acyltransferase family protein n=1 Tax=Butyrivibrio sp. TaxID=28121 RepID=UPI0025B884FF|nr:acyltransferase family protein [Butyrivibrio sp.]MBQ9304354.1 acyltransferase family protein [Butyrivibrio sp.]
MGRNDSTKMAYIDAMKGILIIYVVLLHSLMNAERNIDSEYAILMNYIAYVVIPSFFFVSGYLFKHKCILTPLKSIIKKFKAYYVPFVGFSLFFWLFHNVFVTMHLTSQAAYNLKEYLVNFVLVFLCHLDADLAGPMWFLRALLIMICVYIVIEFLVFKIPDRNIRFIVLAIICISMILFHKTGLVPQIYNLNRVFSGIGYFYMGVLFREYKIDKFVDKYKTVVFIVSTGVVVVYSFTCFGALGVNVGFKDLPASYFGIISIFALSLFPAVSNNRILGSLGQSTLDVMCLHGLAFKVVSYMYIRVYHLDIMRLAEAPVIKGLHGLYFLPYVLVGLVLCFAEYKARMRICDMINKKVMIKEQRYV